MGNFSKVHKKTVKVMRNNSFLFISNLNKMLKILRNYNTRIGLLSLQKNVVVQKTGIYRKMKTAQSINATHLITNGH